MQTEPAPPLLHLPAFKVRTLSKKLLADTVTPVSIYLKLRDRFPNSFLLESSDYHGHENAFTYLCCDPVAKFEVANQHITIQMPAGPPLRQAIEQRGQVTEQLNAFARAFAPLGEAPRKFVDNGLFGYMTYDAVQYFEDIQIREKAHPQYRLDIPKIMYQVFRYVIAINHFNEELYIFEHHYQSENSEKSTESQLVSQLDMLEALIRNKNFASYQFSLQGPENSNLTDEQFMASVTQCKQYCQQGEVFQIVPSRRFSRGFQGDDFNVYRALRSINPSPYLFYFDYGSFRIFGSSPESQLLIKGGRAEIRPIAGTFRRTGNDEQDTEMARQLLADPKENAEHIMLVDLARNDLSRHCAQVRVETYKEVQYYSHVIHLVSKVVGQLSQTDQAIQVVADTFPAGTLSGAPKHRAMQLIDGFENINRTYYGGCIGFMGFNGDFNQAIMIRTFLSSANTLHYQAGVGAVFKSDERSELEEVNNKLRALRTALELAEKM
jgi:anthranilate synthase component I